MWLGANPHTAQSWECPKPAEVGLDLIVLKFSLLSTASMTLECDASRKCTSFWLNVSKMIYLKLMMKYARLWQGRKLLTKIYVDEISENQHSTEGSVTGKFTSHKSRWKNDRLTSNGVDDCSSWHLVVPVNRWLLKAQYKGKMPD